MEDKYYYNNFIINKIKFISITNMFQIGDNVITKDGKLGTVSRLSAGGVEESVVIKVDNKFYAYFGNELKKCQKKQNYSNKIAYFFDGPISMWGFNLTNHYTVSDKMKNILSSSKYNFNETVTVRSSPTTYLNQLINKLKEPNTLGVLFYCGHGNQSSSSSESDGTQESWFNIQDTSFSSLLNQIHETSLLIMVFDSCFSDGIINKNQITNNINYIYYSAARESGPDDTRSALYTGDGGWLTYNFTDFFEKRVETDHLSYKELLNELTSNPQRYYNDVNGDNLHWPKIITSNEQLLDLFFLQ